MCLHLIIIISRLTPRRTAESPRQHKSRRRGNKNARQVIFFLPFFSFARQTSLLVRLATLLLDLIISADPIRGSENASLPFQLLNRSEKRSSIRHSNNPQGDQSAHSRGRCIEWVRLVSNIHLVSLKAAWRSSMAARGATAQRCAMVEAKYPHIGPNLLRMLTRHPSSG